MTAWPTACIRHLTMPPGASRRDRCAIARCRVHAARCMLRDTWRMYCLKRRLSYWRARQPNIAAPLHCVPMRSCMLSPLRGCAIVLHRCMVASLSYSVRRRPHGAGRCRGAVDRRRRADRHGACRCDSAVPSRPRQGLRHLAWPHLCRDGPRVPARPCTSRCTRHGAHGRCRRSSSMRSRHPPPGHSDPAPKCCTDLSHGYTE